MCINYIATTQPQVLTLPLSIGSLLNESEPKSIKQQFSKKVGGNIEKRRNFKSNRIVNLFINNLPFKLGDNFELEKQKIC